MCVCVCVCVRVFVLLLLLRVGTAKLMLCPAFAEPVTLIRAQQLFCSVLYTRHETAEPTFKQEGRMEYDGLLRKHAGTARFRQTELDRIRHVQVVSGYYVTTAQPVLSLGLRYIFGVC